MLAERLEKEWRTRAGGRPIDTVLKFTAGGLVLGAGTVLAEVETDLTKGQAASDWDHNRLTALLAAAYGAVPAQGALRHVRRAVDCRSQGNEARADLHLALSGLPRLSLGGTDAKRLFLADGLIKAGIDPTTIFGVLDAEAIRNGLVHKRDVAGELRNPKGDGTESGEWTTLPSGAESSTTSSMPVKSILDGISAARLAWLALRATAGWATLGLAFVPTNKSLTLSGEVPGYPRMTYSWDRDGTRLLLRYQEPDGGIQTTVAHLKGGLFRDDRGRIIGKLLPNEKVAIEPAAAFELKQREEPKKCPRPKPDYPGGRSTEALDFENHIKARLNPTDPTPPRIGVQLPSLLAKRGLVYYDDCQKSTGTLAEMKWGYTGFIATLFRQPFKNLGKDWIEQATEQVDASQGRPITWFFSDKIPAELARELFSEIPVLQRINVVYAPYRPKR